MKYINSEKLIAEIERRQAKLLKTVSHRPIHRMDELESLLSFITSLQQEQPEDELDALVDEAFDKYSSVDGYGQLSVSFNRAELYSFIKKIARKDE